MTVKIYGIKNCDTMKKAFDWLNAHEVDHAFHDYKTSGIDAAHVERWCAELGWEKVLNRAGTTFKKLSDEDKTALDSAKAVRLMAAQPSMIKRPILETDGTITAGFKPDIYAGLFGK